MHTAVSNSDLDKMRLLMKAGVSPSAGKPFPFLTLAAMHGRVDVFDLLIESGASTDLPDLLDYAVDGGGGQRLPSIEIVERVLALKSWDRSDLSRALRFACVSGSPEVVRLLVQLGADVNDQCKHKDFPLSNAVHSGHLAVVKELVRCGAETDRPVWEVNSFGDLIGTTTTLADLALKLGFPEINRILIE